MEKIVKKQSKFIYLFLLLSPLSVYAQEGADDFLRNAFAFIPKFSLQDVIFWLVGGAVAAGTIFLALRLIRYSHKVMIIDKRGIVRMDIGRKVKKDGTYRLSVLKARANLSWPSMSLALNKKRNLVILIEDNSGQLHNAKTEWDTQAITTEGDFVKLEDLFLKHAKGYTPLKKLNLFNKNGKRAIMRSFPLLQPADTNVMRELIQNEKETLQTYHKPSQLERLAPYLAFATVVIVSAVYWFVVARYH